MQMFSHMISLPYVIALLSICTYALESTMPLLSGDQLLLTSRASRVTADEELVSLDAAAKSLHNRFPHTELSIAAGALLMLLILGADTKAKAITLITKVKAVKTATKPVQAIPKETLAPPPVPPSMDSVDAALDHATTVPATPPRALRLAPRKKPNHKSVQNLRKDLSASVRCKAKRRVAFSEVHVRELVWECVGCCKHGVTKDWECSIGEEVSMTVDAAEAKRQAAGKLTKDDYGWTAKKRSGPKLECPQCAHVKAEYVHC